MVRGPAIAAALLLVASCLVGPAGAGQAPAGDSGVAVRDAGSSAFDALAAQQSQPDPDQADDAAIAECAVDPPADHADPEDDAIGWSEGYWYDEPLEVDQSDGLTAAEFDQLVARTQARVEAIRCLEFENETPVTVQTRAEFEDELANWSVDDDLRTFDNVVHRGLFLVGEDEDAVEVQRENLGVGVAGYYDPETERIVVVSDDDEALRFDETVLAHELVHALQDQHFDLSRFDARTIDRSNAEEGLVEGDATLVEYQYDRACEDGVWADTCLEVPEDDPDADEPELANEGLYLLAYQPYSDGPAFVSHHYERAGADWDAIDALYERPPNTTTQVMYPDAYPDDEPANVSVPDRSADDWERLRVDGRPDYEVVGEAGLFSMLAYPTYHSAFDEMIVPLESLFNRDDDGDLNRLDPYNYSSEYTTGWDGDRLIPYESADGETGYVWTIAWDDADDARQFVDGYGDLLTYWGADPVAERANTYTIDETFPGAYYLERDEQRVTIVHAPSVEELRDLDPDAAPVDDRTHPGLPEYSDVPNAAREDADEDSIPGFGVASAVIALACAMAVARRRNG